MYRGLDAIDLVVGIGTYLLAIGLAVYLLRRPDAGMRLRKPVGPGVVRIVAILVFAAGVVGIAVKAARLLGFFA